jgi:transposase
LRWTRAGDHSGATAADRYCDTAGGFPARSDGLAATVQNELGLDPHSGMTVVFRSKRGDRVKILVWDGTGLVLIYKRLESGQFAWPQISDGVMRLSRAQFEALFEGLDWKRVTAPSVRVPSAAD